MRPGIVCTRGAARYRDHLRNTETLHDKVEAPQGGVEPGGGLGADTPMPPSDDTPGRTNPGIGTSKGAFATGAPPQDVAGQNFETGVSNNAAPRRDAPQRGQPQGRRTKSAR